MSGDEDRIKQELRKGGIQLWRPPYYGVAGADEALRDLARTFGASLAMEPSASRAALQSWQTHALEKLRSRGRLLEDVVLQILPAPETTKPPALLAERVDSDKGKKNSLLLHRINPDLTLATFYSMLGEMLQASSLKIIHKGKPLLRSTDDEAASRKLSACLMYDTKGTAKLLCLVSNKEAASAPSNHKNPDDEALVDSICQAASQLQRKAAVDVTDAAGNHVAMTDAERRAFLTALGLHALGRQRLQQATTSSEDHNQYLHSSLVFLLQADDEWNSRLDPAWKSRVDNYGHLQLDIAWVYLRLESLEHLEDTLQRLQMAERVLEKQMKNGTNFRTLALVRAEQEKPVPAVAATFVRLYLLQGVAYYHYYQQQQQQQQGSGGGSILSANNSHKKSKDRLDWAWALARSLRAVSPPESVAQICQAMGVSQPAAIAALRQTNGDLNAAAEKAASDAAKAAESLKRRHKQNRLGLCANGRDHVDLEVLAQLQTALDLGGGTAAGGAIRNTVLKWVASRHSL